MIFLARAIVRIWNIFLGLITFFLLNISLKLGKNILLLYPIFTILTSFLTFAIKKLILALMQYPSNYISIKEQGFSFFLVKKSYQNIVFHGIFCIKTFATQKCDSILEPCHNEYFTKYAITIFEARQRGDTIQTPTTLTRWWSWWHLPLMII